MLGLLAVTHAALAAPAMDTVTLSARRGPLHPALSSTSVPTPCVNITGPAGICLPYCSQGNVMLHTPTVNDTTAVIEWLKAGGRGLDSAWSYDKTGPAQRDTGLGIQQGGVPRSELFVTTKIPCGATEEEVASLVQYDLDQLMLTQVDLLLIHHPNSPTCNSSDQIITTWQGLQNAVASGKTRSIGVSNFKPSDIDALLAAPTTKITPSVNQIGLHVGAMDNATIQYCTQKDIVIQAYSPLGHPDGGGKPVYDLPEVIKVAAAHNVTGAQVALRWLVQHGWPWVTASPTLEYDMEDLAIFNFTLTNDEMATLDAVKPSHTA